MTKRKLTSNGSSTTLAIPKIMQEHLKRYAGDYVTLSIQGDSIVIKADKQIKPDNVDDRYCQVCENNEVKCSTCSNYSQYKNTSLGL